MNKLIKIKDFSNDRAIVNQLYDLTGSSYIDNQAVLEREIENCNEIYLLNDHDGILLAFFMVGYHKIAGTEFCYLGLSACKEEYKNNGFVKRLYLEFAKDCVEKELITNKRIYAYWTTATPIVYHWFEKYFKEVEPNRHGVCTNKGLQMLQTIANAKYHDAKFDLSIPFVLRQAAHQTNYSENERQRLAIAIKNFDLPVFNTYNLDETNGDRFLMLGLCPSLDTINELLK